MKHAALSDHPWLAPLALAVLTLIFFGYPLLLDMPLADPDEGLHASIAQAMVEQGDWIVPRFVGESFRDKPILYFWALAASLACFGMNEAAVRLPGLLFALLGVATTGMVGARLFDRRTGLLAAAFYTTMIMPTALAQSPVHDVALVPWVNLALLGFWEAESARNWLSRLGYCLKTGLFLGLAALTKGLPGVAVVGVAYGLYLLLLRAPAVYRRLRGQTGNEDQAIPGLAPIFTVGILALVVGGLLASTWYIARELRDPGYLRYFFLDRHVKGFTTGSQIHGNMPFWYYLPVLLLGGLPWIAYLPAGLRDAWQTRRFDRPTLLLCTWLFGGLLFFTVANSKLVTYIWPLFPALAVLSALPWSRLMAGTASAWARGRLIQILRCSCWSGPLVLPAVVLTTQLLRGIEVSPLAWSLTLVMALSAFVPLWFLRSGRFEYCLGAASGTLAGQFMVLMTFVAVPVFAQFSARDLAAHFNARQEFPKQLILVEERVGSLVFYLDKSLRVFLRREQICAWRAQAVRGWPRPDVESQVAVPDQRAAKVTPYLDLQGLPKQPAGRWRIYEGADVIPRLLVAQAKRHAASR